jgi:hypothetical protein
VELREDAERRLQRLYAQDAPDLVEPEIRREAGQAQRGAERDRERASEEGRARGEVCARRSDGILRNQGAAT